MQSIQNPFEILFARLSNIEALLVDIKHQPAHSSQEDSPNGDFTWLKSVAPGIPNNTLRQWDAAGKIPGSSKFGKRRIYHKQTVLGWLRSQTRQQSDTAAIAQAAEYQVNQQLTKRGGRNA